MLMFKRLSSGRYCIIEDLRVVLFDKSGKCLDDNLHITPEYLNGAVKLNYLSILSSGKRLEVAIFKNDNMVKYLSSLPPQDCVMMALSLTSPLCFLRRSGKVDNIYYNQAIFVCNELKEEILVEKLKLSKIN